MLPREEVEILQRYAIWHRELNAEKVCNPCSHCNPDVNPSTKKKTVFSGKCRFDTSCDHCTPCGTCGRE